ncbi:Protein required for ethanol metabolism [Apophysomyces sp. BC1034]|nr:Protein required for ethanol metabolism [Apophysomyces sp. BC1034]
MIYALCVNGPVVSKWFAFLNRAVTIKNPVGGKFSLCMVPCVESISRGPAVGTRLAIDQVVFAPTILAMYFAGISWLEGRSMDEIREKFDQSYTTTLGNGYKFWPFLNLVNFAVVPAMYRPLFSSCGSIAWNSYLSYANQASMTKPHTLTITGPERIQSLA